MTARVATLLVALGAAACGFVPPMRDQVKVGEEPYAVAVGSGPGSRGDLFVLRPGGGEVIPLTFTMPAERSPSLAPDGLVVAFVREVREGREELWLMNLVNGAERRLPLPAGAVSPVQVRWDRSGELYVRGGGTWRVATPPARDSAIFLQGAVRAHADSAFEVLLGDPPFARAAICDSLGGACVLGASGTAQLLAPGARAPTRWGPDSLAYFVRDELHIRPLGPGLPRRIRFTRAPTDLRDLSYFAPRRGTAPREDR